MLLSDRLVIRSTSRMSRIALSSGSGSTGVTGAGRIIDLSKAAAELIDMTAQGIARVKITVLGQE